MQGSTEAAVVMTSGADTAFKGQAFPAHPPLLRHPLFSRSPPLLTCLQSLRSHVCEPHVEGPHLVPFRHTLYPFCGHLLIPPFWLQSPALRGREASPQPPPLSARREAMRFSSTPPSLPHICNMPSTAHNRLHLSFSPAATRRLDHQGHSVGRLLGGDAPSSSHAQTN